jgi:hypothetical protein
MGIEVQAGKWDIGQAQGKIDPKDLSKLKSYSGPLGNGRPGEGGAVGWDGHWLQIG